MRAQTEKNFSLVEREAQIVARVMLRTFLALAPAYYGARHLGAAMEKILIVAALRDAEARGKSCTVAALQRMFRMPRTSVQRALAQLEKAGAVVRVGRAYHASELTPERINKAGRETVLKAIIGGGMELQTLVNQASAGGGGD